jgi:hypothetical protein
MIVAIGTFANRLYARFIRGLNNLPIIKMKMQGLGFFSLWLNLSCFGHLNFILSNVKCCSTLFCITQRYLWLFKCYS